MRLRSFTAIGRKLYPEAIPKIHSTLNIYDVSLASEPNSERIRIRQNSLRSKIPRGLLRDSSKLQKYTASLSPPSCRSLGLTHEILYVPLLRP